MGLGWVWDVMVVVVDEGVVVALLDLVIICAQQLLVFLFCLFCFFLFFVLYMGVCRL